MRRYCFRYDDKSGGTEGGKVMKKMRILLLGVTTLSLNFFVLGMFDPMGMDMCSMCHAVPATSADGLCEGCRSMNPMGMDMCNMCHAIPATSADGLCEGCRSMNPMGMPGDGMNPDAMFIP